MPLASEQARPWHKEPWPWVIIAMLLTTIIACVFTYFLAVSHPDYLVIEEDRYLEVKSQLSAQPAGESEVNAGTASIEGTEVDSGTSADGEQ